MLGFDRLWPSSRRRRADAAPVRQRIEPTLPDPLAPASGKVRLRVRYNDAFAVALTEQEAAQHGLGTEAAWSDVWRSDEPSREIIVDVPVPRFSEPAAEPIQAPAPCQAADPPPIHTAPTPDDDRRAADAAPTPARSIQPTLSPAEHAERLLAWCRRRGLVGEVIIMDIERAYAAMCVEEGLRPRAWNPVGCELNFLLTGERGGKKRYATLPGGERRRAYRITPASVPTPQAMRAAA